MFQIRYVSEDDKPFGFTQDKHIDESEFLLKVRDKKGYIFGKLCATAKGTEFVMNGANHRMSSLTAYLLKLK